MPTPFFPTLSSGSSFKYPITRTKRTRVVVHQFCDFTEQRYRKGPTPTEFTLGYNHLSTADKELLRVFYVQRQGELDTTWVLTFDGITFNKCQFIGPFEATNVGFNLWDVKLSLRAKVV